MFANRIYIKSKIRKQKSLNGYIIKTEHSDNYYNKIVLIYSCYNIIFMNWIKE